MSSERLDVAVIGAGLSGLVAGLRLQQAGAGTFAVFEAKDRVGGRTLNQPLPDGRFVEGGGQWAGPTQTRVLALAKELGVETFPTYDRGRNVLMLDGRRRLYRGALPLSPLGVSLDFARAAARLQLAAWRVSRDAPWTAKQARAWDAMTLGDWLDRNLRTEGARAIFEVVSGLTLGGDPAELSLLWVLQHLRTAGGLAPLVSVRGGAQDRRFVGGSQALSLRIAERLGARLRTGAPVEAVEWRGEGVEIRLRDRVVHARRAIVAMSPPDRSRIRFGPALPPAQEAFGRRMTMTKGIKAHIVYPRPFWRDLGMSGQALGDRGPAPATFDNSPPDGGLGVLVAFVAGKTGAGGAPSQHQLDDADARREGVLDCLASYFGEAARHPADYVEKDWRSEPFSEGCIPAIPPGVLTEVGPGVRETTGPLIWAGTEASHVWGGYMDGAVRAGERAADLALRPDAPPAGPHGSRTAMKPTTGAGALRFV